MRGTKALLVAVIVMGLAILLGTAVLISVLVHRAFHLSPVLAMAIDPATRPGLRLPGASTLTLDQPAGTRITAVTRQSDLLLAITLAGGGIPDRVLIWDTAIGHIVATFRLGR